VTPAIGRLFFSFVIVGLFIYVIFPLILPLAMGAIFAVLFFPWLEKLERRKFSTGLASALLTVGITLVVLIPSSILLFIGARTGVQQLQIIRDAPRADGASALEGLMNTPGIRHLVQTLTAYFPVEATESMQAAVDLAKTAGLKLADLFTDLLTRLPGLAMGLVITVISIYFFLVDGRRIATWVRNHSVFSKTETERLIRSFAAMCRSVILATVVSGFVQAALFAIACVILRVPSSALIAFIVFLASFLPLIGSAPVTFGVAFHQLLSGNRVPGIALLVVAVAVGLVDNFIRPMVLRGSGNLHPLLAFVAAFGGLQVLGFPGVFIGPIVAGLCVVTVDNLTRGRTA
jgi:predicted PurR-regulated permease PerM